MLVLTLHKNETYSKMKNPLESFSSESIIHSQFYQSVIQTGRSVYPIQVALFLHYKAGFIGLVSSCLVGPLVLKQ